VDHGRRGHRPAAATLAVAGSATELAGGACGLAAPIGLTGHGGGTQLLRPL